MYGYMLLRGKFYELGEIKNCRSYLGDGSILAFPLDNDPNNKHIWSRGSKVWKMSDNEGEVFKCRTVWLENDNPERAKKLIAEALMARRCAEIEKANTKCQNAIEALNISYVPPFRKD